MVTRRKPARAASKRLRTRIRTAELIERLTDHVNGRIELDASQVNAALSLLKKSLPDLVAEGSADDSGPARMVIEWRKPESK